MQKKIIIKGRWNNPIEFEIEGSLEDTLKKANDWCINNDAPGYFFEVETADFEYIRKQNLPIFINNGKKIAPTDLEIR